jgi:cellulose synthase/poly-beta-1,6-N-acetylglucosamine synthase-like glycosyltransferase
VGLFSDDTFAEDFDATMKLSKAGYVIEYEENAIAYTDAPKSLEDLMKQRRRWYRGMIQVLDKHRDMFLRPKYGFSGILGVPNLWFETTSPIINLAFILLTLLSAVFLDETYVTLIGLATYLGFDMMVGLYALILDPVKKPRDFLSLPLLSFYNIFLDGVRLMSFTEEILNIKMAWEKPKR